MPSLRRRDLLLGAAGLTATPAWAARRGPPALTGLAMGDVSEDGAVVWGAADGPGRLLLSWDEGDLPAGAEPLHHRVRPLALSPARDHTASTHLALPPDRTVTVRAHLDADPAPISAGQLTFRTAPTSDRPVRLAFGADLCGQGWGIDPARGGLRIFDAIAARDPDLFVFAGDRIYADGVLPTEIDLPDGTTWRNVQGPWLDAPAESLEAFRARYRYPWRDAAYRRFHARVPLVAQWDDHEVIDNWAPGGWVRRDDYAERHIDTLAFRGRLAMAEHTPMRRHPLDWARTYRRLAYGPLLDLFVTDTRSYRGINGANAQIQPSPAARWLGPAQADWLVRGLRRSRARWKVVVIPQPIGTLIYDDFARKVGFDGAAQGDGPPLGRELELADVLRRLGRHDVRGLIVLTADVHYAAVHHYHPDRAAVQDFPAFWELVTGPLHAGSFGPNPLDATFGPEAVFTHAGPRQGAGPAEGGQHFGELLLTASQATSRVFDGQGLSLDARPLT